MKIRNIIASLTVIGVLIAGSAFAMPNGATQSAQSMESLSLEQRDQWNTLHEEHIKKVRPLRSSLKAKRMEYKALMGNTEVSPDYISDLTSEIVDLENRIEDRNEEFLKISEDKFNIDFSSMTHNGMRSHPNTRGHGNMSNKHHGMQSSGCMMQEKQMCGRMSAPQNNAEDNKNDNAPQHNM